MSDVEVKLSDKEFSRIRDKIYKISGIALSDSKRTLVVSRLSKLVRAKGLASFNVYVDYLDHGAGAQDQQVFVNALTTNLTRFYREDHHFDHLGDFVGEIIKKPATPSGGGRRKLRIWSAGCSTGQEPYTIAMCLMHKYPQLKSWDFKILATDLDTNVIAKAASGTYAKSDLDGLSKQRAALFESGPEDRVRIPAVLRNLMTFKPLNLMGNWPIKGPFDAIFCRNVTIYFDKETQTRVFGRFAQLLKAGGFLYIGHSENMRAESIGFKLQGKTIYQRENNIKGRAVA